MEGFSTIHPFYNTTLDLSNTMIIMFIYTILSNQYTLGYMSTSPHFMLFSFNYLVGLLHNFFFFQGRRHISYSSWISNTIIMCSMHGPYMTWRGGPWKTKKLNLKKLKIVKDNRKLTYYILDKKKAINR